MPTLLRDFVSAASDGIDRYSLSNLWFALRGPTEDFANPDFSEANTMNVLPNHWSIDMMDYDTRNGGIKQARVFSSSVPAPRGVIGFIPGWKTSPAEKIEALESFREAGFIVMSVGLENPGMETGSLDDSLNRINSFVFDPDSPLYTTFDEDLPRFVITHSTSGMLYQHALLEARRNGDDMPNIRHAYHTAPFFDTAGSSLLFHPIKNRIYTGHAMRHMNELAGTPLMDRLYYYYRGLSNRLREENPIDRPTHGQILEISAYGAGYLSYKNAELKSGEPIKTLDQTYIISTDDSFSCPKTAEHSAELEDAIVKKCKADHNPLKQQEIRQYIINDMKRSLELFVPDDAYDDGYGSATEDEAALTASGFADRQPV